MPSIYDRLFAHLVWADDRTLAALRAMPIPDQQAMRLLAHILGAEGVWMSRLIGDKETPPIWPELDLTGCETLAADIHERYRQFSASLNEAALARTVRYRNSEGNAFDSTVQDILQHVALHGSYHRGQIALLLRLANALPAATDYIAFTRGPYLESLGAGVATGVPLAAGGAPKHI